MTHSRVLFGIIAVGLALLLVTSGSAKNLTGAFFTDVETSPGNIFVAGVGPDLLIDHPYTSYNGEACSLALYSGTSDTVKETGLPAVATWVHPGWTADISGATWIWKTSLVEHPRTGDTYTFSKTFYWHGGVGSATMKVAADNNYWVYLNGNLVATSPSEQTFNDPQTISIAGSSILEGTNVLEIKTENLPWDTDDQYANPAGLLYNLSIQRSDCNIWTEPRHLEGNSMIYNFDDAKPGDYGTDIISLHVSNMDTWSCLLVKDKVDLENVRLSQETAAGDTSDEVGELSKLINLFGWLDTDQDGTYDSGEPMLFSGSLSDFVSAFAIADSQTGSPLYTVNPKYVGVFWCFGSVQGNETYNLHCDGSASENNQAQTDQLKVDFVFLARQYQNNPYFKCSDLRQQNPPASPED